MTYNKGKKRYRKGKTTSTVSSTPDSSKPTRSTPPRARKKRRPSFMASMMKMLFPFLMLIGLATYLISNFDVEELKSLVEESQTKERVVEVPERKVADNEQDMTNIPPQEEALERDNSTTSEDEVFTIVEQMPRFEGCEDMTGSNQEKKSCADKKMLEFIFNNVKYPAEARQNGYDGLTVIQVIIDKEGHLTEPKIIRTPHETLADEALRVVNAMPAWIPGKRNGKAVKVQYNLPIRFNLK